MLQTNQQPAERLSKDNAGMIDVHSVWLTMQGEGPFVGKPAVFVRLAGCNLTCPLCDTDYTYGRHSITPDAVVSLVQAKRNRGLVVITGGEPFRQPIGPLCSLLINLGYLVQIETNGTLYQQMPWGNRRLVVVCSPKTPKLNTQLKPYIHALKYVMAAGHVDSVDGLPLSVLGQRMAVARPWPEFTGDVYLQPEDHCDPLINKLNLDAVLASCMHHGYRLCLQVHKLVGLP